MSTRKEPRVVDSELAMETAFAAVNDLARRIGGDNSQARAWLAVAGVAALLDGKAALEFAGSPEATRRYRRVERALAAFEARVQAERLAESEGRLLRFPGHSKA